MMIDMTPPKELRRIRLEYPKLGIETDIVVYELEEGKKYQGCIYRRASGALTWDFAGHTIETHCPKRAETFARNINRDIIKQRGKINAGS